MIAPARRCPPFRDRDSLTGDHTEKGAACTSGEPPWPWPMPPLVSRSGDLNLRHCTITYAGDGGRSERPCTRTTISGCNSTPGWPGQGRCRCVIRSILHQEGREGSSQAVFLFLFLMPSLFAGQLGQCFGPFNFNRATACHVHQDAGRVVDYSFCSELLIAHCRLMHRLLRCNSFGAAFTTSNR